MTRTQHLILNRYRPIAEAGAGGFGTVQVAWDTRIQRRVAIKCIELDETDAARAALPGANAAPLPDAPPADGSAQAPFADEASVSVDLLDQMPLVRSLAHIPGLDEARTAAMLSDANIVAVYDFEVQDATAYLIMEYVEGISLSDLLRHHSEQLTLDSAAAVFLAVAHALEVAHSNQVLHLDIKPDNILINHQGQVKVTDFGLATLADASGFGTAGGGTIGYMPLEQMRQENLDVRCDEWALASVMYEVLAGENPFVAHDLQHAEAAIEDAELVLPSLCWDDLDPAADDVIFYALDPDRDQRYATVSDFAEELAPCLGDAARGIRELAAIVGYANDDEDEELDAEVPAQPYVPLRERITPLQRAIATHAIGGAGSALVAFVALGNMPQTSGFANPLFWGILVLVALAGALRPHLGALLAYFTLSATFVVQGVPAAGFVLVAATAMWWYFVGREGYAEANAALVVPLAGAVGLAQLAPLVAGLSLPPARATATAAFSALIAVLLAACGSHSLLGWDVLANGPVGAWEGLAESLGGLLMQPSLWCVVASWIGAAGALAAIRLRPTRLFAALGVCVATAVLLGGLSAAAWFASGQLSWLPSMSDLACTLVPATFALGACTLIPDWPPYDEAEYEAEEEAG